MPKPNKGAKGKEARLIEVKRRPFPPHALEETLALAQKIQDEMGGKAMNKLLLAEALGIKPSSSNFRDLLSSAYKYGLIDGTEKADSIGLTPLGTSATQADATARMKALRSAALTPGVFGSFFRNYANKKLPSTEMLPKILTAQYQVPNNLASECAAQIATNGKFVDFVRDIGGSPHILLDAQFVKAQQEPPVESNGSVVALDDESASQEPAPLVNEPARTTDQTKPTAGPRPIFVGHGKNKAPLQQLQTLLSTFQIPHKVVKDEANLGRPIPQKVKDTIEECGSAILIFTRDEQFFDADKNEIWRPSENVVHELGATSFAYGDRIVIFKEKGLYFPTNFQSIGYIEFESGDLTARTADLLKELIGFGLVKVTPTQ